MDAEVMVGALLEIREQCTDPDGKLDKARYDEAVGRLKLEASQPSSLQENPDGP